jgi:hypothetical protein
MFDLGAFMQKELARTGNAPSRRTNKQRSGRTLRKQANSQATLARVGGFRNPVRAIYAPANTNMCHVVDSNVGWLPNGQPRREPRVM